MEVRIQLTPLYRSTLTFSINTLVSNDVIPIYAEPTVSKKDSCIGNENMKFLDLTLL